MDAIASPDERTPASARDGEDGAGDGADAGDESDAAPAADRANVRARRFDADRHDQVLSFEDALDAKVTSRHLLWIDIEGDLEPADGERMAKRFSLDRRTRHALEEGQDGPFLAVTGRYLHVRVAAEPDPGDSTTAWLDIIAAEDIVITRHDRPVGFLVDYDSRIEGDTSLGTLGSVTFLGSVLDDAITSYHGAVDRIEDQVDVLDTRSLRDDTHGSLLDDLVALRRRIARLRRLLADHRAVFAALASRDIGGIAADEDGRAALAEASGRFDRAMSAVESSREVLLGSFEVYMTRTAQRTNEVMKVLTLATVLLLPGSMVAGLLGMNVIVPLNKDDPLSFWLVVGSIAVLAVVIVVVARARRWL